MSIKKLVLIGLCATFSYVAVAQDSSEDKQFVENFMQAQPNLKYISQSEFAALSEKKQQEYKSAGYIICVGESLTRKDVEAYQAARASNANPEKSKAYVAQKNNLPPVAVQTAPTFRLTRAELAANSPEKKAYMLAHPEIYIIID
jgi:hypothetical protein